MCAHISMKQISKGLVYQTQLILLVYIQVNHVIAVIVMRYVPLETEKMESELVQDHIDTVRIHHNVVLDFIVVSSCVYRFEISVSGVITRMRVDARVSAGTEFSRQSTTLTSIQVSALNTFL